VISVDGANFVARSQTGNSYWNPLTPLAYVIAPGGDDDLVAWARYTVSGLDTERPVSIDLHVTAAPILPGGDEDLPLSCYVGVSNFTAYAWRWFGPFTEAQASITLNDATHNDRVISSNVPKLPYTEGNLLHVVVAAAARKQFITSQNPKGLTAARIEQLTVHTLGVNDPGYTATKPHFAAFETVGTPGGKGGSALDPATQHVQLTWPDLLDPYNEDFEAVLYRVYRQGPSDPTMVALGSVDGTQTLYVDPLDNSAGRPGPVPGVPYTYFLRAYNPVGWTRFDRRAYIIPLLPPADLQATDGDWPDKVYLTWTRAEGAEMYYIYRDGSLEAPAIMITDEQANPPDPENPDPDVRRWWDRSVSDAAVHAYRIRSVSQWAHSDFSLPDEGQRSDASPVARLLANPASGEFPLTVNFDASSSSDPDGSIIKCEFDFGEGAGWEESGAIVQHTYNTAGVYTARVRVTDNLGVMAAASQRINSTPVAALAAAPLSGNAPLPVNFDASASSDPDGGAIAKYEWDWDGDGTYDFDSGTDHTVAHTYNVAGNYGATVRVTDDEGALDTDAVQITVSAVMSPPVAVLYASPLAGAPPLTVDFDASGSYDPDGGGIAKYEWDWETDGAYDFDSGADPTVSHVYNAEGMYTATVRVTDNESATATHGVQIVVSASLVPPVADLHASPPDGNAPLAVDFDASGSSDADGTIARYEFDFGEGYGWQDNGGTATIQHTYYAEGTYTATVRVTDNDGATDTASTQIPVGPPLYPPVADLSAAPLSGNAPLAVDFDASGSYDPDGGSITRYEWDWNGDATYDFDSGTDPTAAHTYNAGGVYQATVRVTDGESVTDTASTTIDVNAPPTADLVADPTQGPSPLLVNFDASGSSDSDGSIADYEWDFDGDGAYNETGNGESAAHGEATPSYTYNASGAYSPSVRVTDNDGATDTAGATIDVNAPPTADLSANPAEGNAPLLVNFDASGSSDSDGTITLYEFDFGEGAGWQSNGADPTIQHTYNGVGDYTARVRVTDNDGATDTDSVQISASTAQGDWWMFGRNPLHTHRSPFTGPATNSIAWEYAISGLSTSSPAIAADGTVYVGSSDNKLYAINPDGSLKWASYNMAGSVKSSPAIGDDGTIYVGDTSSHRLHAISPDGTQKWAYTTLGEIASSPAIGADGTLYVGSYNNGGFYAIYPDGTLKWTFTADVQYSSPAIDADGTIYIGSDVKLYAINPNGTQKWVYTATNSFDFSSPAIGADGTVYVGNWDHKLYAIYPDGTEKWTYTTGNIVESSPAIGADGTVYVGSDDWKLYAINPDGTQKWTCTTDGEVHSSPAIDAGGTIYVGELNGGLWSINPDGTRKWSCQRSSAIYSSPAIGADGTVYFCDRGSLCAIGPGGG
jgi:PKD repeat protein